MSEDGGKRKRTSDERKGDSHDIQFEKEKNHKKTSVSSPKGEQVMVSWVGYKTGERLWYTKLSWSTYLESMVRYEFELLNLRRGGERGKVTSPFSRLAHERRNPLLRRSIPAYLACASIICVWLRFSRSSIEEFRRKKVAKDKFRDAKKSLQKRNTAGEGCKSQTEIIFFRRIENSKMACGVEVHVYIVTQNTVRWLQWRRRTKGRTHRTDGRRGKHVFPDSWRCGKEEMENIGWTCLADYQLAPNLFLKVNHKMKIWIMKKKIEQRSIVVPANKF